MYNSAKYIDKTIKSCLNQTYKNIQIIIINDGSNDQSLSICQKYKANNLIIISQNNKGAAAARNKGLSIATGNYIQFLDADDSLPANKIESQIEILRNYNFNPSIISFCAWKHPLYNIETSIFHNYENPIELLSDFFKKESMLPVHCYLLPKAIVNMAGPWNETLSRNDDGEWFARVISLSTNIIFCNSLTVYYNDTPDSLSKAPSIKDLISEMNAYIAISEIIRKKSKDETVVNYIHNFILKKISFYYPYYKEYRNLGENYLKAIVPQKKITYPRLTIKTKLWYFCVRIGILKSNYKI